MVKRRFEIDAESRPDLAGMILVTIHALKNLGGSATIQELDEKVVELEGVTEDGAAIRGQPDVPYRPTAYGPCTLGTARLCTSIPMVGF